MPPFPFARHPLWPNFHARTSGRRGWQTSGAAALCENAACEIYIKTAGTLLAMWNSVSGSSRVNVEAHGSRNGHFTDEVSAQVFIHALRRSVQILPLVSTISIYSLTFFRALRGSSTGRVEACWRTRYCVRWRLYVRSVAARVALSNTRALNSTNKRHRRRTYVGHSERIDFVRYLTNADDDRARGVSTTVAAT